MLLLLLISGAYFTIKSMNQFQYININQSLCWLNIYKLKCTITYLVLLFFKKRTINISLAYILHADFWQ